MEDEVIIGERVIWGQRLLFGLSRDDRRRHIFAVGQTGTGKSTLMRSLIAQDINRGNGSALLDPHGDLAESILDMIPSARIDDVIFVDPADLAHPVAWNPFYRVPIDERPLAASNLVAAFKHVWRDSWGPRLEYLLYNSLAAILDAPDHLRPTILSVPRMLVDGTYRKAVVRAIRDPQVRFFWEREFASWNERFLSEIISPVQNKIGAIVTAPSLRNILGQWRPTIDLARAMGERKILLLNLSKGRLGEDKANLIGSLFVAGLQAAAMRRASEPEEKRADYHLFVDEFHNFGTDVFASILSESRKFRLTLTLAMQFLAQTPDRILDAVLGNVGNVICFRVGADDAKRMAHELTEYSPDTLRGLATGEACVRLLRDGESQQPFLGSILRVEPSKHSRAALVRQQVRQRYTRRRDNVERNIANWLDSKGKTTP